MKKILLALLTCFSICLNSQTVTSSCTAPETMTTLYRKDADRLALRRTYYTNSTYKDSVTIKTSLRSSYLGALLAVYNATSIPARDTVVNLFTLHTNPNPELNLLTVQSSGGNAWMQSLQNSTIPTGYQPIDALLLHYNLQVQAYYQATQYDQVILRKDTSSNINVLAAKFATVTTVFSATPAAGFSDVKNITDSINPNFIMLKYAYGWGSCQDGCDFHSYWTFKVFPDCSVQYMGRTGSDLIFAGIRQNGAAFTDVMMHPNPADESLQLILTGEHKAFDLEIVNTVGQTVFHSANNVQSRMNLDVSSYTSGIYYLRLKNEDGVRVMKLVKN